MDEILFIAATLGIGFVVGWCVGAGMGYRKAEADRLALIEQIEDLNDARSRIARVDAGAWRNQPQTHALDDPAPTSEQPDA